MLVRSAIAILAISITFAPTSAEACWGWPSCRPAHRCGVRWQCPPTDCCVCCDECEPCGSCTSRVEYGTGSLDTKIAEIEDHIRILQRDVEQLKRSELDKP